MLRRISAIRSSSLTNLFTAPNLPADEQKSKASSQQKSEISDFTRLSDFLMQREQIHADEWKKINACLSFQAKDFLNNFTIKMTNYLYIKQHLSKASASDANSVIAHIERKYSDAIKTGLISKEDQDKAIQEIRENYSNKYRYLFEGIYCYRNIFSLALIQIKLSPLLKLSAEIEAQKVVFKDVASVYSFPSQFILKRYQLFQQIQQFCDWLKEFNESRFVEPTVPALNEVQGIIDGIFATYSSYQLPDVAKNTRPNKFKIINRNNKLNHPILYDEFAELETTIKTSLIEEKKLDKEDRSLLDMIDNLYKLKNEKWSAEDIDYDKYVDENDFWHKRIHKFDLEHRIQQQLNLPKMQKKKHLFEAYIEFKNFMMAFSKGEMDLSGLKTLDVILPKLVLQATRETIFEKFVNSLKYKFRHYFQTGIFEGHSIHCESLQALQNQIVSSTGLGANLATVITSYLTPMVDRQVDVEKPSPKLSI